MPNTLKVSAKCSDMFSGRLTVGDKHYPIDGYVPSEFGIGGGDYVEFDLDLDTGKIIGFDVEKAKRGIAEAAAPEDEDD
jgi:hypothetical protein